MVYFFFEILLLFKYSCLHSPPATPPCAFNEKYSHGSGVPLTHLQAGLWAEHSWGFTLSKPHRSPGDGGDNKTIILVMMSLQQATV